MSTIKIFISHKREDQAKASEISTFFLSRNVDTYLDVLDAQLAKPLADLGEYFRSQIGTCTHLLVVVSSSTQGSWWVPFEIGIATEKIYPISTFALSLIALPDFLKKWPYLTSTNDLEKYLHTCTSTQPSLVRKGLRVLNEAEHRSYSDEFHQNLKRQLGQ